ncbi:MAG: hypothetical protein EZS28_014977 [Streblomastix strix]|uniref:Uncharacterized protein n=1 Tax=Streblomastix strix TaxID=222440 RepID=A0A5J4W3N8_9EUKA|nr:MAG: hypothetical protein EZS28_014977 [Streblomastix strix]
MPKKGKKGMKSKDVSASASEIFSDNMANQQTITGINDWRADMEAKPYRIFNYQKYRPPQVAKIPDILRSRGIKLNKAMNRKQEEKIQQEIMRYDNEIQPIEAKLGVLGIIDDTQKRKIYGGDFPYSLQQQLLETSIRISKEGRLILENYIDSTQRYTQNINKKLDQPTMNLGSKSPPITEEQQRNELMNEGSQRQQQILSRQLIDEFANQEQGSDLGQLSFVDDVSTEYTLAQEKLNDAQRQEMEADYIALLNLNTIYDIGALDWGRSPVNDIYGRQPFETYASGYKYDQFGNPIAYMKKRTQPIGKKYNNMKKNYIPTSQLIQTAKTQADLYKQLTKSAKITKKK